MIRQIVGAILATTVLVAGVSGTNLVAQRRLPRDGDHFEAAQLGWLGSLDEGKVEARQNGLPLMVVIRCVP